MVRIDNEKLITEGKRKIYFVRTKYVYGKNKTNCILRAGLSKD